MSPLHSDNPYDKAVEDSLLLIIAVNNLPDVHPHELTVNVSGSLALAEPREIVVQKGFEPEVHPFHEFKNLEFSHTSKLHRKLLYTSERLAKW